MSVLVVNQRDVAELLPMPECIDLMAEALTTLGRGDAILPLRSVIRLPDRASAFAVMPAYLGAPPSLGVKIISVFPRNEGTPWASHQGATLLFDADNGRLLAIIDASSITAIRTAAVSGVATRLLAAPDAGDLALLGAGVQARTHLEAMRAVRAIRRVRIWSRSPERAHELALAAETDLGVPSAATATAREAVEGADIICTTTSSAVPVLEGAWIARGAHVNAVGASLADARELDTAAVRDARVYVDRRESALAEAGDILIPMQAGAFDASHIVAEVGEVLLGRAPGRVSPDQITLFKSLGIAVEDVAAAHHIYERARERGRGITVELGGLRELA